MQQIGGAFGSIGRCAVHRPDALAHHPQDGTGLGAVNRRGLQVFGPLRRGKAVRETKGGPDQIRIHSAHQQIRQRIAGLRCLIPPHVVQNQQKRRLVRAQPVPLIEIQRIVQFHPLAAQSVQSRHHRHQACATPRPKLAPQRSAAI